MELTILQKFALKLPSVALELSSSGNSDVLRLFRNDQCPGNVRKCRKWRRPVVTDTRATQEFRATFDIQGDVAF